MDKAWKDKGIKDERIIGLRMKKMKNEKKDEEWKDKGIKDERGEW